MTKLRFVPHLVVISALAACSPSIESEAKRLCEEVITKKLLSPASAVFPEVTSDDDILAKLDGGMIFTVEGQVDAANRFGTLLRRPFGCVVDLTQPASPKVHSFLGETKEESLYLQLSRSRDTFRQPYHEAKQTRIRHSKRREADRKPPDIVSYEELLLLRNGLSIKEVQDAIGHPEIKDRKDDRFVSYTWENYDGSSLVVLFEGGRAYSIQDSGLW